MRPSWFHGAAFTAAAFGLVVFSYLVAFAQPQRQLPVSPKVATEIQDASAGAKAIEHFEANVRPLLVESCSACHTKLEAGGLRVDSREALLKGGSSGPAIVPGK